MIFFRSDYGQGAHPAVLRALTETNAEHTDGYGLDPHCERAAGLIRQLVGREDCAVHFMIGGTSCNVTVIAAGLRPYESVVAARSGHAYTHETGAVEATGHRVVTMDGVDGKLTPELIDRAWEEYEDEHTALPRMVYLSQPTELGTLYSRAELAAISEKCRARDMLLYVDGARLGAALTAGGNDLPIRELARLCDAFYIGGTKNGALFGEALVVVNSALNDHFRWMIKRQCGMLAKGRLLGVQFEALLDGGADSVYFKAAAHANEMAERLRQGLAALSVPFFVASQTNQVFPTLPAAVVKALEEDAFFYEWVPEKEGKITIRLVTGWDTDPGDVAAFLSRVSALLK